MENILTKTTSTAMYMTAGYLKEGDLAVDATCGNGHDTLSLALAVGRTGRVLALDVQERAVEATKGLLREHGISNVITRRGNFAHLKETVEETFPGRKPAAVVFNLGYLPGGDKGLTTKKEDSLAAAAQALELIRPGGIVTMVLYSGHAEGAAEKEALLKMAEALPADQYHVVYTRLLNQRKKPPEALFITKKKETAASDQ